jgi:hypothetical protein
MYYLQNLHSRSETIFDSQIKSGDGGNRAGNPEIIRETHSAELANQAMRLGDKVINEAETKRSASTVSDSKARGAQWSDEARKSLIRLLLLAHSEQILSRSDLMRVLEMVSQANGPSEILLADIKRLAIVDQLDLRLARYANDLEQILDIVTPTEALGRTATRTSKKRGAQGTTLQREVLNSSELLPGMEDAEFDSPFVSDLKVSWWPKLLAALGVVAIVGLIVLVVMSAISSGTLSQYFTKSSESPYKGGRAGDSQATTNATAVQENYQDPRTSPPTAWRQELDAHARQGHWETALKFLQDQRSRSDLSSSDRVDLILRMAGVLIVTEQRDNFEQALEFLLDDECLGASPSWPRIYAAALVPAGKAAREKAIEKLQKFTLVHPNNSQAARALDWTRARDGSPASELPELTRRIADIELDSLDHMFLTFVYVQHGETAQLNSHLQRAAENLSSPSNQEAWDSLPSWMSDEIQQQLTRALEKLRLQAKQRAPI